MALVNGTQGTSNINGVVGNGSTLADAAIAFATQETSSLDGQGHTIMNQIKQNQEQSEQIRKQSSGLQSLLDQIPADQSSGYVTASSAGGIDIHAETGAEPSGYAVSSKPPSAVLDAAKKQFCLSDTDDLSNGKVVTVDGDPTFKLQFVNGSLIVSSPNNIGDASAASQQLATAVKGTQEEAFEMEKSKLNTSKSALDDQVDRLKTTNDTLNLQLQNVLNERTKALELSSNILKNAHDAEMSIIKNMA